MSTDYFCLTDKVNDLYSDVLSGIQMTIHSIQSFRNANSLGKKNVIIYDVYFQ